MLCFLKIKYTLVNYSQPESKFLPVDTGAIDPETPRDDAKGEFCEDVCGVAFITFVRAIGGFTDAEESWDVVADDAEDEVGAVVVVGEGIIGAATVDVIVVVVVVCTWLDAFLEKSVVDPTKSVKCKFIMRLYYNIPL